MSGLRKMGVVFSATALLVGVVGFINAGWPALVMGVLVSASIAYDVHKLGKRGW